MKQILSILLSGLLLSTHMHGQNALERQLQCSPSGASGTTYACNILVAPAAYVTQQHYRFTADVANTGAATINFNSLGAKTIKKAAGGITTDLVANDIRAGQIVDIVYDGTNMQMQSTLGNAGSGSGTVTSVTCGTGLSGGTFTTSGTCAVDSAFVALLAATNVFSGNQSFTALLDASAATHTLPVKVGTAAPATCTVGELFFDSDASAGSNMYGCTATNTFTALGGGGGGSVMSANSGYVWAPFGPVYGTGSFTSVMAASTNVRWAEFYVQNTLTVNRMALQQVTASGTCGGTCGMQAAIFNSTCSTQVVASPVITSGGSPNLNGGGAPYLKVTISSTTLQPGFYWLGYATDSTALQMSSVGTSGNTNFVGDPTALGSSTIFSTLRMGLGSNNSTGSGGSLAIPASGCGTLSAPAVGNWVPNVLLFQE